MALEKFELRLKEDPVFLARFIAAPREALESAGIQLEDPSDVKRLESFARSAQTHLQAAGSLAGFELSREATWGIGISCCNGKSLQAFDADQLRKLERQSSDLQKRVLKPIE